MGKRQFRRKTSMELRQAVKRFERQRRLNLMATPGRHPFIVVLDHLKPRFNIGKIFRSADAFGASEVHLVGTDFFDPAPGMGSFKWVPARFFEDFDACYAHLQERWYDLFMLDPSAETKLTRTALPARSAFVFGHEEYGFSFAPEDYPHLSSVAVPQFGKVQSLNVSVAASLVMYEYIRQHAEQ